MLVPPYSGNSIHISRNYIWVTHIVRATAHNCSRSNTTTSTGPSSRAIAHTFVSWTIHESWTNMSHGTIYMSQCGDEHGPFPSCDCAINTTWGSWKAISNFCFGFCKFCGTNACNGKLSGAAYRECDLCHVSLEAGWRVKNCTHAHKHLYTQAQTQNAHTHIYTHTHIHAHGNKHTLCK